MKIAPPPAAKFRDDTKKLAMADTLVKLQRDTTTARCRGIMAETKAKAPPAEFTKALSFEAQDHRA